MGNNEIKVCGAKENNLKNISVTIPHNCITVITGVSGSGKSSLAYDVIYCEGQRRFLDTLSLYEKGFFAIPPKPKVDSIKGLSSVISIKQSSIKRTSKSNVGTLSDIGSYMKLLYSNFGVGQCPLCGKKIRQSSITEIIKKIKNLPQSIQIELRIQIYKEYKDTYDVLLKNVKEKGFRSIYVDNELKKIGKDLQLSDDAEYILKLKLGPFVNEDTLEYKLSQTMELVQLSFTTSPYIEIEFNQELREKDTFFDTIGCKQHGFILSKIQPFQFSANGNRSICNECGGEGYIYSIDPEMLVEHPEKSLRKGSLNKSVYNSAVKDNLNGIKMYSLSQAYDFSLDTPFQELDQRIRDIIFYGTDNVPIKMMVECDTQKNKWLIGKRMPLKGIISDCEKIFRDSILNSSNKESTQLIKLKSLMEQRMCTKCKGTKFIPDFLTILIDDKNIVDTNEMDLESLMKFIENIHVNDNELAGLQNIRDEVVPRISLLINLGLGYLSLSRSSNTLSGGELQRMKIAKHLGNEISGITYIIDEPSCGLHSKDVGMIIRVLKELKDIGNTLLVIEHNLSIINEADYIVEIGPDAGDKGGYLVFSGNVNEMIKNRQSVLSPYFTGAKTIPCSKERRKGNDKFVSIVNAYENNLQHVSIDIPLGMMVCVTGVSGSGKSTLIHKVLYRHISKHLGHKTEKLDACERINGMENLSDVALVDQSPIGRSSKSTPATYLEINDKIRSYFAENEQALRRGYTQASFNANSTEGLKCMYCDGLGLISTQYQFMDDIEVVCPICKGKRFSEEVLEIKYKGLSINDVNNLTFDQAREYFSDDKYIMKRLTIANKLGLGYIKIGQNSTTLSGGEAQRIKLIYELSKLKKGEHILYIFDEPTIGLHIRDIIYLKKALDELVDAGHSIIIIEHNMELIQTADYIIDLGPEAGNKGGFIIANGTPEEIITVDASYTGRHLKKYLDDKSNKER